MNHNSNAPSVGELGGKESPPKIKLFVGYHEWAGSVRTSGFPVYALLSNGNVIKIGNTQKKPTTYLVPSDAVAVFRYYESNLGNRMLYIYIVPRVPEVKNRFLTTKDLHKCYAGDKTNWDIEYYDDAGPKLPPSALEGLMRFIERNYLFPEVEE